MTDEKEQRETRTLIVRGPHDPPPHDYITPTQGAEYEDLAHQEFKDEANIDKWLERWGHGSQAFQDPLPEQFADVSKFSGLYEAYEQVKEARDNFQKLNPDIREYFGNSAETFVRFLDSKPTPEELLASGLTVEYEAPAPQLTADELAKAIARRDKELSQK